MAAVKIHPRNKYSLLTGAVLLWVTAAISTAQDATTYSRVDDEQLKDAFRSVKRNDSLQFDLPDAPKPPKIGWLEKLGEWLASLFKALGPILEIVFWIGLGCLLMGAIYIIAQTIYAAVQAGRLKEKSVKTDAPPPLYEPEQKKARILLEEIDALAAQGRYDEAVHVLLHRSIQDIDSNRPNVIRRSLTSREIGTLSILTEKAQTAFSSIAQIVEHSFFGGHSIGKIEFERAREAYSALTASGTDNRALAA